jgi:uncharacterized protein (TIGR02271 family)
MDEHRTRDMNTGASAGRLARLGELDNYTVADGDPDIRGWEVKTSDGRKIGKVNELIVDPAAMQVRYMEVKVDDAAAAAGADRLVLVPIGTAHLDDDRDDVHIDRLPTGGMAGMPAYSRDQLDDRYEQSLSQSYGAGSGADRDLYDEKGFWGSRRKGRDDAAYITRSEEELSVDTRRVQAGEVDVHKRVETEHVKEKVPVTREEVTVERRPVSGDAAARHASGRADIREDEIRVPLMADELVVEKHAVPKEEVVIRKHTVRDEKTVEADLRKERIDVDRDTTDRR